MNFKVGDKVQVVLEDFGECDAVVTEVVQSGYFLRLENDFYFSEAEVSPAEVDE